MQRLLSAEVTVQLNYGIPAAVEWMPLESLLFEFHEQQRDSYLSPESVMRSLGTPECPRFPVPSVDRARLMELATYGMVVVEPPGFVPCSSPPVF